MPSRFCALLCLLVFAGAAKAQRVPHPAPVTFQVNGQVRYSQGGRPPAELVLVRLEFFGGGVVGEVTTDRSGKFRFSDLRGELYIVSVKVPGYLVAQQEVDLRTQVTDYVQLQLVPDANSSAPSLPQTLGVIDANVPNNALVEFQKGSEALLRAHNLAEAIAHLQRAVEIYPKYSAALVLLGTAYLDEHRWDNAEAVFRQVLAVDSKSITAHLFLGELYLDQRKYPESQAELSSALSLDPKSARGHLILGRLYYELGELTKAGPEVGTALRINPRIAEGHLLAGNILLRAHQPENALVEFEEYVRLDPNGQFSEQAKQAIKRIKEALEKRQSPPE